MDNEGIEQFIKSSLKIAQLKVNIKSDEEIINETECKFEGAQNVLFAYDGNEKVMNNISKKLVEQNEHFERKMDISSGIVSAVCVANKGLWKFGKSDNNGSFARIFQRLKSQNELDYIAYFIRLRRTPRVYSWMNAQKKVNSFYRCSKFRKAPAR